VADFMEEEPCVVMGFCDGGSLLTASEAGARLKEVLEVFVQLADALAYLHESGVFALAATMYWCLTIREP